MRELADIGISDARERGAGVIFSGGLEAGYRACLHSRVASRVLLRDRRLQGAPAPMTSTPRRAPSTGRAHIDPARTLACDFSGRHPAITHTQFGALRLKDAICDRLRADSGRRPDVDTVRPAVRVHAHANGPQVTLFIDLSGEGLHRRGYRS